jgi:hypothetical protein
MRETYKVFAEFHFFVGEGCEIKGGLFVGMYHHVLYASPLITTAYHKAILFTRYSFSPMLRLHRTSILTPNGPRGT